MREIIKIQPQLGTIDISEIHPDPKSRDEIDKIVTALVYIYSTPELKEKVFSILNRVISPKISKKTGRPGMDIWQIFVLAVFRNGCNIDYDKLHNLSNNHKMLRQLLGHSGTEIWSSTPYYHIQTIKDNVSLLSDSIVNEINGIVVEAGHKLLSRKKKEQLDCNVDSFVVETDIHFPTDINLLYDSIRKSIQTTAQLCESLELTDWRQSKYHIKQVKRYLRQVQKSKRGGTSELKVERHRNYVKLVKTLITKVKETQRKIESISNNSIIELSQLLAIDSYLSYAEQQIALIDRRVFKGEIIPNQDKILSIFEPHTRWISKGKLGKLVEFGIPVCIIKDQNGLILHHIVMEKTVDSEEAVHIIEHTINKYSSIRSCSFDKGFWSPDNYAKISEMIEKPVMPKKGKVSKTLQTEYDEAEYVRLRRRHSSVESSINSLEYSGLDKCLDHGIDGFKSYVSISIVARNLQTLGNILIKKTDKKKKRKKSVSTKKVA